MKLVNLEIVNDKKLNVNIANIDRVIFGSKKKNWINYSR